MKIALLHDSVLPAKNYGGIERVVVTLAKAYQKLGHQVVVLSRKGSDIEGIECLPLPEEGLLKDPSAYLPSDVDFIHSHQPLLSRPQLPFLVTIHGNGHPGERYWPNTAFLTRSHAANHGAKYFVPNGIECEGFPFVEQKEDYFVFLARARWKVKNLRTAIDLANDLKTRLEVIGGTGLRSKYVRYHGSIGEKEGKLEIVSKARALLYPTNWEEPFGIALLEAWACGTPVVASKNGAMAELVSEGVGFSCDTYASFLDAARRVTGISPRACRDYVEQNYSARLMAERYLELMTRILEHGDLDQQPQYSFRKDSVRLLYKPNLSNRIRRALNRI